MTIYKFKENTIYCGDNLTILNSFPDECVDLIYIDPPFMSGRNYDLVFEDKYAVRVFNDTFDGKMESYLSFMEDRIRQLRRVLKPTGSFYLHCDWHAGHYLKVLCDKIFGIKKFRSEIIWKRHTTHNDSKSFGNVTDTIFYYSKNKERIWNTIYIKEEERPIRYNKKDNKGYFFAVNLDARGLSGGGYDYEWKGYKQIWRLPISSIKKLEKEGKLYYSSSGRAYKKKYYEDYKGVPKNNLWDDLNFSSNKERKGYPTQKPEALLERIIMASSNEGDVVLDAFCGCGTTIAVANKLGRKWIGIDVSPIGCTVMAERINYKPLSKIQGMKFSLKQTKGLNPFEFQAWAVRALGGIPNIKKTADKGVDGWQSNNKFSQSVPVEVKQKKSGIGRPDVDKFATVINREKKKGGFMIGYKISKPALAEIARTKRETKKQIIFVSVDDLLDDKEILIRKGATSQSSIMVL